MRKILIICAFLASYAANAQTDGTYAAQGQSGGTSTNAASVSGTILFLPIQSLRVELTNNAPMEFLTANDYNSPTGKQYNNYMRVFVTSTIPWVVGIKAVSETFYSNTPGASDVPVNLITLRGHNSQTQFGPIRLSNAQQTLLHATNNAIHTIHDIDINVNPGWKYAGGSYRTTLLFTLTSQ